MIERFLKPQIEKLLSKKSGILLLGPRQVGKSTLINTIDAQMNINLSVTQERIKYERNPSVLINEIEALKEKSKLIIIDEIQNVPDLLNDIQSLIDGKKAQFLLSGSSARKLRSKKINWLPGRVINLRLDAISFSELTPKNIESALIYGQLPKNILLSDKDLLELELKSYIENYLDQEIRAEAAVRNIGQFHRFLELAALESGKILNYSKISKELGPAVSTITSYFDILRDCLIVDFIEPITESSTRKKLSKTPKLLFFDMGVRRLAAQEGPQLGQVRLGELFEQQIGLELLKFSRTLSTCSLHYWRDHSGPEVDWVLKIKNKLVPIEVKWTQNPDTSDTQHLVTFHQEYKNSLPGWLVCRVTRKQKLKNGVLILPWQDLMEELSHF